MMRKGKRRKKSNRWKRFIKRMRMMCDRTSRTILLNSNAKPLKNPPNGKHHSTPLPIPKTKDAASQVSNDYLAKLNPIQSLPQSLHQLFSSNPTPYPILKRNQRDQSHQLHPLYPFPRNVVLSSRVFGHV